MNKKKLLIAAALSLGIIMMGYLCNPETIFAQECRIIRMLGGPEHSTIMLEPETLFTSKGDCVVWFNRVQAKEIQVIFEEGKKCSDGTMAPMGFSYDQNNCYVTNYIPFAGTSSLRFMEKGTYNYVVKAKGLPSLPVKGQIVVE